MSESRGEAARWRIANKYWMAKTTPLNIHTVTFQPKNEENQDRIIVERWSIGGDRWLLLAVCDGHFGSATAEYVFKTLPTSLHKKIRSFMYRQMQNSKLDRTNIHEFGARFTTALKEHIERFDRDIGEALKDICPNPEDLTEADARELIARHMDVVVRAFQGTTLALALVNLDHRFMWAAGVGDSTVALSTVGSDGKRKAERLCELHTYKNPKEYYRAVMAHSYDEQPLLDWEDRMLGWLAVPRAIGDFALKFRASYLTNLFNFTPYGDAFRILKYAPKIITPPYVIAEPSVRFVDLEPIWGEQNKLLLFTDGVDNLVDGNLVFNPEKHSGADPVDIVSALLSDEVDPEVQRILGHPIDPHWSGDVDNKAIDILGNLLGGTDVERLEMVTDEERLRDTGEGWPFHIDDTSIIVWGLADV